MLTFYAFDTRKEKFCYIIGLNKSNLLDLASGKSIDIEGESINSKKDIIIYSENDDKALYNKIKQCITENTKFTFDNEVTE